MRKPNARTLISLLAVAVLLPGIGLAHDPELTQDFDRERCTFSTWGNNPWFPLWPGLGVLLEGEEEDDGETIAIAVQISVLSDTEVVDGVRTRVVEEREWEDDELVEISRNFFAHCRESGAVWYFGEDVDDFEDGEIVGHEGGWRAGENGATPGIIMPGTPLNGARFLQENAPGEAEDWGEIVARDQVLTTPYGTFQNALLVLDSDALDPGDPPDEKYWVPGLGLVKDEEAALVEVTLPSCMPDATTLCLQDGRFRVEADWATDAEQGDAMANQITDDSGELWFFGPENVELLVKVLDACGLPEFQSFWVFAAGLTTVEVEIRVTDTASGETQVYGNDRNTPFQAILDTDAFETCP